jgi:hypothetical protein
MVYREGALGKQPRSISAMCRPLMPLLCCLSGFLLLGLPAPGFGQADDDSPPFVDVKEWAKQRFEASQAAPHDLAKRRLEAARTEWQVCYWFYRVGESDHALDFLLDAADRVLRATLALSENAEQRQAALEAYCSLVRGAERIVEAKYSVGRIGPADYAFTRQMRLRGELRLREAGARAEEPIEASWQQDPLWVDDWPGRTEKETHAKFTAVSTPRLELARARRDAARWEFQERYDKYRAGAPDTTLDLLLEAAEHDTDAELVLCDKPSERVGVWSRRWEFAWEAERIVTAKYRVGRASLADLMQTRADRLSAEIRLAETLGAANRSTPLLTPPTLLERDSSDARTETKELARAQFEASQTSLRDLALARREAIRVQLQVRMDKYRAGAQDATLDLLLKAAKQNLDAELAVALARPERVAAHERLVEWTQLVEDIVRRKYEVGRVSRADYAQSQYECLDAEIRLREAREKGNKK